MTGETVYVDGEPVENVLVEPGSSDPASEVSLPVGTVVEYTLRFPCSHVGPVHDSKVTVRGVELETLSYSDHWHPAGVFGSWSNPWDMTVLVGRTLGDYSATARIVSVSAEPDALGDPVASERTVYDGPVQARQSYGSEPAGADSVSLPSETWYFVVPWQDAFAALRPQSTFVEYGDARYDVRVITNVAEKSEQATFEAVRRG